MFINQKAMRKWTLLAVAMVVAIFFLWQEALMIVQAFFRETKIFFGSETVGSSNFLTYIRTILSLLMLAYVFVWFWWKLKSPLLSIIDLIGDTVTPKSNAMKWQDKTPLFLTIGVLFISIIWFTKFLVYQFAIVTTMNIWDILFQIISIAIYFGLSHFTLELVKWATLLFIETESNFQKITFYSALYVFFIWLFYTVFSNITMLLNEFIGHTTEIIMK